MKTLASVVLVAAFVVPISGFAQDEKQVGDLAALQGRWKAWLDEDVYVVFEIEGRVFTLTRHEGMQDLPAWKGTLVLDEFASPKQLNWVAVKSGDRALPDNRCIYELHDDTWLLIGGGADTRPSKFISGEGTGMSRTLVLKREKAEVERKGEAGTQPNGDTPSE